jgi:hypothetical protein
MMNLKLLSLIAASLTLFGSTASAQAPVKENLVGLFFANRDNLTQKYRGEFFPIARYANGRYTDPTVDVTEQMRRDAVEADIVKQNAAKSILKSNPTLSVLDTKNQKSDEFAVNGIGIGQFSCSSLLVGRGKLSNGTDLKKVFDQLPESRESTYGGSLNGKEFNETRRWSLALQSPNTLAAPIQSTSAQLAQYRKAAVRLATAEIAKKPEAKAVKNETAVEEMQVFDLDRDGKPEIFARVRKGQDPKTVARRAGKPVAVFANVWLNYAKPQSTLLASQVQPYTIPVSDMYQTYQVLGTLDVDGDGKQEVLIRNTFYEAINYSLWKLQGNQLKSVYSGAPSGC